MALTRAAQRIADELGERAIAAQKSEYRARIQRIQQSVTPALSNAELSLGLGLDAPKEGQAGGSSIGRYVSVAPRNRRARPDSATRALIDALLDGTLLLGVRPPAAPGARREVLVCDASDVAMLPKWWEVQNLGGRGVPDRPSDDWDEDDLWDLFDEGVPESGKPTPPRADAAPGPPLPSFASTSAPQTLSIAGVTVPRVGLGCMRLSTAGRPERSDAIAVLHAALDAGVRLLDTADTYALDDGDLHHNEALIAEALATWEGPAEEVLIATKAGLARPNGRWVPAGRPEQLRAAVDGSLAALGVETLPLLQLHAPHGKGVSLQSQVETLAALKEEGKVAHIGLCNIKEEQLDAALQITSIDCVQLELSRSKAAAFKNGLVARCHAEQIPVIAYAPVGGHRGVAKTRKDPALAAVAAGKGASVEQVAIAWVLAMGPGIAAIPGATRALSATSSFAAGVLPVTAADQERLEVRRGWAATARTAIAAAVPPPPEQIVLIAGPPAAGKTSRVQPWLDLGFERLNRDTVGGRLSDVDALLRKGLEAGRRHFVLDNTYPSRTSRAEALALGARFGVPVRLVLVDTPRSDAYVNACLRMIGRRGRLLDAKEIRAASKDDPNMFPPGAVDGYFARRDEPGSDEAFSSVEVVPFARRWPESHSKRALILDYDGTLRRSTGPAPFPLTPDEVEILPGRAEALTAFVEAGWLLLGVSNQSGIARGQLTQEGAKACFDRTNELLGHDIDVRWDAHPSGRIDNWTRKPMPGLGVQLTVDHELDPGRCVYVGDMETDAQFAAHCGFSYADAADFFDQDGWRFQVE
ncbi:MAG: HAD-IIIA family hydrolase [Deltaproteobacteria bacterium]|nr:HAD-IIIA family hydrolase [Deltaproteobacteria bacterium]